MVERDRAAEEAAELAEEQADSQRKAEPRPVLARGAFKAWRSPRVGDKNPSRFDNPLWHWLVRTRWSAYSANEIFGGSSAFDAGPMWCFDRFGKSETTVPTGDIVHIGGEHEDHYDPDFYIYNDVVVVGANGSIAIYGFPYSDFAPTDFHSATLIDNSIIIIGCLGHPEQRIIGQTPVYRLVLDTMTFAPVDSAGDPPGWISSHSSMRSGDGKSIVVRGGKIWRGSDKSMLENIDEWSFDLSRQEWTRLTALEWQRWTMRRVDLKTNRLWDVRQAHWESKNAWPGLESYWSHDEPPDFDALAALYRLDEGAPLLTEGIEHNVYLTCIDCIPVRFTEDRFFVQAIVEGRLSKDRLAELQERTLKTLERLDASVWEIEQA